MSRLHVEISKIIDQKPNFVLTKSKGFSLTTTEGEIGCEVTLVVLSVTNVMFRPIIDPFPSFCQPKG